MTLPSQTARSSNTARTFTRSRRRRRGKSRGPVALLVLVVLVLAVGSWVLVGPGLGALSFGGDGDEDRGAENAVAIGEPTDALSRPVEGSNNRSWGERGLAPVEPDLGGAGSRPATGNTPTGDGRNLSEARRNRQTNAAPSPLAAALQAENREPEQEPSRSNGTQPAPTQPAPNQPAPDQPVVRAPANTPPVPPAGPNDEAIVQAMRAADAEVQRGNPSAARRILEGVVGMAQGSNAPARDALSALNRALLFGPKLYEGEPITRSYVVQPGDSLSKIASKENLGVDWRLVQRINGIGDPSKIRVGQTIKLLQGPFHGVVHKGEYRLDIFHGPTDNRGSWRYVMSAPVGLGESGSTPTGAFTVKPNSRLINPYWVNPRTGERFDADDKNNPIGERWIGLEGLGADAIKTGYGLHGTIDPSSIGAQQSMGCIRLGTEDVELVYELLMPGSLVSIVD